MAETAMRSLIAEKGVAVVFSFALVLGALWTMRFELTTSFFLSFAFLGAYLGLPYLLLLCLVNVTEEGIEYVRFGRVHHISWSSVAWVRGVYWFPLKASLIRIRGITWPFCYILADDSKLGGTPTNPLRYSEGDTTKAIRAHLLRR